MIVFVLSTLFGHICNFQHSCFAILSEYIETSMKVIRRKMRNGGFGPSLRKPSMKKESSKLMKDSLKQLKKTRECYKVFKRDTVVPQTNNFASSS
jgi:hypothetical protein